MIYDLIHYFDMFAGIGGFRAGFTRAGGFQCVGHCEIDKYADASYRAIHNPGKEELYYPDARTIDPGTMPDFDLLCGGFPCQAFSTAGKRLGFEDSRGTLFFEIARLAAARRPSYLLLENVPGLLSHDKGRMFTAILSTLSDLGYGIEWLVLNSKDFGVPQSRRRVYIVCYLDRRCAGKILPVRPSSGATPIRLFGTRLGARVYAPRGIAITQLTDGRGLYLTAEGRVRRLTPRESLRLQGFTEAQIDRLLAITSDAQAYKQAGNSVTVNVIEAIGRNLKAVHEELRGST